MDIEDSEESEEGDDGDEDDEESENSIVLSGLNAPSGILLYCSSEWRTKLT